MRYRENRADRFALRHSDADELKGAVRYFTAIKRFNASLSATHPQYTSDGELAKGFHYPKTSARIALFLTEIKKRTGEDYHPDSSLIDQHIELLKANDDRLKSILTPSLS